MEDDEDEIDILGDFDLENLLTRRDRTQASYSLSSNDNYSLPSSDWILENASPLFNVKSVLTSDQVIYDNPCPFPPTECLEVNPNIWTEKERTLLDRGLELFGKSHSRLSQYIGTKNPSQVKNYLRSYPSAPLTAASSINSLDGNELDTVEVVVSSVDNPSVVPSPSYSLSTLSDDYLDSLGSDSESYMGSTTSEASESDRPVQQEFHVQKFYEEPKVKKTPPPSKPKKQYVKKRQKPAPPPADDESDDSVDYDNTNIIFKPRKLSKYHLMVKSGDRVLPTGEQVVRIKKEEMKSDTDVDVLESDNESPIGNSSNKPQQVDVDVFNPNKGVKINRVIQPKQRIVQVKEKSQQNLNRIEIEDNNEEIEIDVVDDLIDENIPSHLTSNAISSFMPIPDIQPEGNNCNNQNKKSKNTKRTSSRKYEKSKRKTKTLSGGKTNTGSRNVNRNSKKISMSFPSKNVYLKKSNVSKMYQSTSRELPDCSKNKTISESYIDVDIVESNSECTANESDSKLSTKKTIIFKELDFRSERHRLIHVDDVLANYDFSNVRLLDHNTQMLRISQLKPVDVPLVDGKSKYISIEEIDYHRDFFLHNDAFFINRFLRIRNFILREWICKRPKYINKTAIRSGLKHCGTMVLIARIHSYLEQKGLINT